MKRIPFLALLSLVIFYACTPAAPKREEIIGVWVSDDGAEFQFNDDSTFTVTNIPESIFVGNCESKKLNSYNGTWSIRYWEPTWRIDLTMPIDFPKGSNGFWGAQIDVEKNLFAHSRILSFFDDEFVEKNFYVSSNWLLYFMDFCDNEYLYVFKKVAQ